MKFSLGLLNISSSASWSENGMTVAGQSSGISGLTMDSLYYNRGISITDDDILYIADRGNNRIVYVPLNRIGNVQFFGVGEGSGPRSFDYPCDIHLMNRSIYILDHDNSRVQKYSIDGLVVETFLQSDSVGYSFNMFVDQNENLYLSDYDHARVLLFLSYSSIVLVVAGNGITGSENNQLNRPNGIYVNDRQTIYIADTNNHRIQKWIVNSTFGWTVAGISGISGSSLSQLFYPESVVVDINGYMYIVDEGNNRVVRWAPNASSGVCIAACTGIQGTNPNQFYYPIDLAFDSQGSLYVSDDGNSRVQRFQILNTDSKSLF